MANFVLQLKHVTKTIKGKTIIHDLSFEVPKGEVFGFLGPNGAGKTTTIRMMVGLMKFSTGQILIDGISIQSHFEEAMKKVGAIVENPEMYKYLSGYKNLVHFANMYKGVTKARIDEVVKLVGLEQRIHDKVKTYSLGMRQRLGVAQALLHKPSLLILDEPTNGLDPAGISELRDYLRTIAKTEDISILVSSHLLSEMELMCDRVAIIQNGSLISIQDISREDLNLDGEGVEIRKFKKSQPYLFLVQDVSKAKKTLVDYEVVVQNEGIEIDVSYEEVAIINRMLTLYDVPVYGIRPVVKTLEERFLEITRGDGIV
ncbi:bacitracin ABC transporter ATP-binding protein [Bacillus coahuilensis m2-6]|uniref:Bacitracin ABC transporter ATP-binding protein n=1 Tax=Bacillus coahuilensis p1.1.43 TaxID=1150625 RepID=A0A147K547_9BACI|nr:ATP-binding cassette domain-containing protein [Bacillus coahuilensis]KUP04344.1 bacitracin ABC transporter ATP-binding protein [Bacillus coahuilensis m2-6]KUP04688.1 bacitracin ABC transporter ATP-binding protein [Bacillus coahuilensis p1.1.43]